MPTDDKDVLGSTLAREAVEADVAVPVVLAARNEETLAMIPLDVLKQHAIDLQ